MDSQSQPNFNGYVVEHEVVEECDLKTLELECPNGSALQRTILHNKSYRLKKIRTPDSGHTLQKSTETWVSEPIYGRLLSATAVAHATSPGRRLSFSKCTVGELDNCSDDLSSAKCIPSTEENHLEEFSFEDEDLKQENLELRQQNRKQVEDLREIKLKLHDAEDKNQSLELHIRRIQSQLIICNERLEKGKEEYRQELEVQNGKLEAANERMRNKSSRLNRLEKQVHDLQTEKSLIQAELEKVSSEIQYYHQENNKLKTEFQKAEVLLHSQLSEYSLENFQLQQENSRICLAIDELHLSYEKLEREKNELVVNKRCVQDINDYFFKDNVDDEMEEMNSTLKFDSSYPAGEEGISIFAEIQSSLQQSPFEILGTVYSTDETTQTDDENVRVPYTLHLQKAPMIYGHENHNAGIHRMAKTWNYNEMTNTYLYYDDIPFDAETTTQRLEYVEPLVSNNLAVLTKALLDKIEIRNSLPWSWKKAWRGMKLLLIIVIIIFIIMLIYRITRPTCGNGFDLESAICLTHLQPPRI